MTPETTTQEVSPKKTPTRHPLPAGDEAFIQSVKDELAPARLGHLARRYETLVRDAQETMDKYGHEVVLKELLGHKVSIPIHCELEVVLRVRVGDGPTKEYPTTLTPAGSENAKTEEE